MTRFSAAGSKMTPEPITKVNRFYQQHGMVTAGHTWVRYQFYTKDQNPIFCAYKALWQTACLFIIMLYHASCRSQLEVYA